MKRICILLIAIGIAACTRFVVLDPPPPDAGMDGHGLPDGGIPDAFIFPDAVAAQDAGTLD